MDSYLFYYFLKFYYNFLKIFLNNFSHTDLFIYLF